MSTTTTTTLLETAPPILSVMWLSNANCQLHSPPSEEGLKLPERHGKGGHSSLLPNEPSSLVKQERTSTLALSEYNDSGGVSSLSPAETSLSSPEDNFVLVHREFLEQGGVYPSVRGVDYERRLMEVMSAYSSARCSLIDVGSNPATKADHEMSRVYVNQLFKEYRRWDSRAQSAANHIFAAMEELNFP